MRRSLADSAHQFGKSDRRHVVSPVPGRDRFQRNGESSLRGIVSGLLCQINEGTGDLTAGFPDAVQLAGFGQCGLSLFDISVFLKDQSHRRDDSRRARGGSVLNRSDGMPQRVFRRTAPQFRLGQQQLSFGPLFL